MTACGNVRRRSRRRAMIPYLLLAPSALLIMLFKFYPILNTVLLSFRDYSMLKKSSGGFVGLANYLKLLTGDAVFTKAFYNSLTWVGWNVAIQALLGLVLAILLNKPFKGRGLYRSMVFAPWAVSGLLVSLIWSFMFNESVGVIGDLLLKLGVIQTRISWFSSGLMAMTALLIASTWRGLPFFVINIMASLQTIPDEVYESGKIDGADSVRSFFHITLPMIRDPLVLTTLLRAIWTLNSADMIYAMTNGGPNYGTTTVPVYIMTTFQGTLNFSYTSAMSMLMCAFMVVVSLGYLKLTRYGKESLY